MIRAVYGPVTLCLGGHLVTEVSRKLYGLFGKMDNEQLSELQQRELTAEAHQFTTCFILCLLGIFLLFIVRSILRRLYAFAIAALRIMAITLVLASCFHFLPRPRML